MKKCIVFFILMIMTQAVYSYEYREEYSTSVKPAIGTQSQNMISQKREIKNLTEYFKYLPGEVNRNWTPYKSNSDYEVTVKFKVNKDGTISTPEILNSTNPRANVSVLNAVTLGAPYQPLPKTYPNQNVTAQVVLEYHK